MSQKNKKSIALTIFTLVFITDIYAVVTKNFTLEVIFKPLLMTSLAFLYIVSAKKVNFWFLSALFFSFWGDVFLLFKEKFFVLGLGSFLIAHLLYIKIIVGLLQKSSTTELVKVTIPFLLFFGGLLQLVAPNLGKMLVPVIVYGFVISTFGTVALLHYRQEKNSANLLLLLGACIFIASDGMIALKNFHQSNDWYQIAIIITYVIAQFLICKAMITKLKTEK